MWLQMCRNTSQDLWNPSRPQSRLTGLFPAWEHREGTPTRGHSNPAPGGCLSLPSSIPHLPCQIPGCPRQGGREEVACLARQARPSCAGWPNLALRKHIVSHARPQAPQSWGSPRQPWEAHLPHAPRASWGRGTSPGGRGELWRCSWGYRCGACCPLPARQQSGPRLWMALEMHLTTSYPVSASHCCWSVYHQDHMGRDLACPWSAHRGPDHPEATLRESMAQDSHSPTPFHCGTVLFRQL